MDSQKVGQHKIVGFKLFYTKADALEYRELFFSDCEDARLIALSFGVDQAKSILGNENLPANIALKQMLANQIEESTTGKHADLGFDLIGIEDAGDFHSFHCHDLANQLQLKFNLALNQYGLLEPSVSIEKALSYLNNDANNCLPVAWYSVKVKLVEA